MHGNKRKGQQYEILAKDYLIKQGMSLIRQNYHCRFGEIDLIMLDRDQLCFVEVKYRKDMGFGGAAAAIPASKQKKIVKTALFFIAENAGLRQHSMRFDALLIQQQSHAGQDGINWIANAFYAE